MPEAVKFNISAIESPEVNFIMADINQRIWGDNDLHELEFFNCFYSDFAINKAIDNCPFDHYSWLFFTS